MAVLHYYVRPGGSGLEQGPGARLRAARGALGGARAVALELCYNVSWTGKAGGSGLGAGRGQLRAVVHAGQCPPHCRQGSRESSWVGGVPGSWCMLGNDPLVQGGKVGMLGPQCMLGNTSLWCRGARWGLFLAWGARSTSA